MATTEALTQVLQAEENAKRLLEEALAEGEAIVKQAREEARAILLRASERADCETRKLLDDAHREAEEMARRLLEEVSQENAAIRAVARERLDAAVHMVLEMVLEREGIA
ncbi:MAG: hypothetical protein HPY71_09940 [Firmicutes bacterium]|nr:hypothetical protein [Bacillota bacterium]